MTTPAQRMRGLAALVALAVLIAGVPWALWTYAGGAPWDAVAEPGDWLSSELDDSAIVSILTLVMWAAWAYFVVCVAVEVVRARQDRPAPSGGVGAQPLARRLVASVLLLIGTATISAPAATAATGGGAGPGDVPAVQQSVQAAFDKIDAAQQRVPANAQAATGVPGGSALAQELPTGAQAQTGLAYYVQPPHAGNYDCLWDIADRTLGDPLRWREIYQLNKGVLQEDGNRLIDPDLIYPGWQMRLPDDARGPNVIRPDGQPVGPSQGDDKGAAHQGPGTQQQGDTGADVASEGATSATSTRPTGGENHSTLYAQLGLGGGLIAAGLLWGLRRQRGWNGGDPPGRGAPFDEEHSLQLRADRPSALFADRAMRSMGTHESGVRPSVARLGADRMSVRFDGVAGPPAKGWLPGADAYEWTTTADALTREHLEGPSAAPQLACIGVDGGEQVLVNLAAAGGVVAVSGDRRVATEMARSIVIDLATHAWADVIEVIAVGFHEDLLPLGGGRLRQFSTLDDAISHVRGSVQHRLSERVIVSADEPSRTQLAILTGFATDRQNPIGVFCCGEVERAGLRLSANADGVVVPAGWGMALNAQRLPAASIPPLVALYGQEIAPVESESPQAVPGYDPWVADPGAGVVADIQVLGDLRVDAVGEIDDERLPLSTEIVVCLALHPEGVHQRVLEGMLWPRGASDDVVSAALETAQTWLTAPGGASAVTGTDGRWFLDLSRVRVDWHVLTMCNVDLARSGLASAADGLRYVTGAPLAELPAERYAWVRPELTRRMRETVVSIAETAAVSASDHGRPREAVDALRAGLRGVPDAEVLWRRMLRLAAAADTDVAGLVDEMFATLGRCGSPRGPEGSTLALVDDLLPNRPRPGAELSA
ncbi:LysM peptidoglycan-binding domain-containing protein [Solicola gregarius]|uniref:LysM peptidoglycan-binding domain-containing protein n=1 Tax=Solicola gregarius TaxID=2908642 RepID=A0AA46TGZ0_9ACTN|nr:LysM peptidoglycan-binding domain-containing protein [Solicola gregarius]UYM04956.1 LysM peptidoglycan-binding domain-containing protein [Solicola gregarius]